MTSCHGNKNFELFYHIVSYSFPIKKYIISARKINEKKDILKYLKNFAFGY